MTLSFLAVAIVGGILGAYYAFRRKKELMGIVPASRLQKEFGLYAENRPDIRLDPSRVPIDLRGLIPLAEKWGVGDDIIRNDLIDKATAAERQELHDALYDTHERITEWLKSVPPGETSDEVEAFMYMQGALDEMGYFLKDERSGRSHDPSAELPRHVGENKVRPIPAALLEKLNRVPPSRNREMLYYPCRVVTRDGSVFDRVYVQPREPYLTHWGILPFDDRHKGWIAISEIVDLEESPFRLPPNLAGEIYQNGETGMGTTRFRVDFRQGTSRAVITGTAVDFIPLAEGEVGADAVRVHPITDWHDQTELGPRYYWSIYDGVETT